MMSFLPRQARWWPGLYGAFFFSCIKLAFFVCGASWGQLNKCALYFKQVPFLKPCTRQKLFFILHREKKGFGYTYALRICSLPLNTLILIQSNAQIRLGLAIHDLPIIFEWTDLINHTIYYSVFMLIHRHSHLPKRLLSTFTQEVCTPCLVRMCLQPLYYNSLLPLAYHAWKYFGMGEPRGGEGERTDFCILHNSRGDCHGLYVPAPCEKNFK